MDVIRRAYISFLRTSRLWYLRLDKFSLETYMSILLNLTPAIETNQNIFSYLGVMRSTQPPPFHLPFLSARMYDHWRPCRMDSASMPLCSCSTSIAAIKRGCTYATLAGVYIRQFEQNRSCLLEFIYACYVFGTFISPVRLGYWRCDFSVTFFCHVMLLGTWASAINTSHTTINTFWWLICLKFFLFYQTFALYEGNISFNFTFCVVVLRI